MCGFFAALGPPGSIPNAAQRRRALDALSDRGPDGEGLYAGECSGTEFVFGHRRLAIVGLKNGAQPLVSGGRVLLVNGEFYNYKAIRHQLQSQGVQFETEGDSEIALRLYEFHRGARDADGGPGPWVAPLTGEWTFVLWDSATRTLWAACDPFGTRPLRYWVSPDGSQLKLASETKALLELGIGGQLDDEALRFALEFQFVPWRQTLFRDVKMLPPGTWLRWQFGRLETGVLWDHGRMGPTRSISPSPDVSGLFQLTDREVNSVNLALKEGAQRSTKVDALRAVLDGAVERRIPAETAYCAHLSGGVDSASVAALVSRTSKNKLHAFTASFPWAQSGDETALAMVSANLLGLKLHTIEMDPNSLLHAMDESSYRAEGLAVNLHAGAKILLAHATRESGYKVTFTGEGADEAFYGYEFFRSDFNESERPKTTDLNLATLGLQRPDGDAYGDLASLQDLCGAIPAWLKAKAVSGHTLSRCFGQRLNETPINRARLVADLPEATRSALQNASSPERARSLWTIYGLSGYILRGLDDPNGMSRGVESRFVFLDPAVQWLAARIAPLTHYGIDGIEKGLMREALGDVLPKEVSTRPKRPFLVPSIFELEVGRRWARERLLGGRLVSSGLFSEFALNNILSQAASPGRDARICTLASLSSFMNVFNLQ